MDFSVPADLEQYRERVRKILAPIVPPDKSIPVPKEFYFSNVRSEAGYNLPPYYLVYFLFVDLLQFEDAGPDEKVAWIIPIHYNSELFTIEHRKFGLGIFSLPGKENECSEIAKRITNAVNKAQEFFKFMADKAVSESKLNVKNNCSQLYRRYEYFLNKYKVAFVLYKEWRNTPIAIPKRNTEPSQEDIQKLNEFFEDACKKQQEAAENPRHEPEEEEGVRYHISEEMSWLAQTTIEAFFSWTEHTFIHIAILQGKVTTGEEVAKLAAANWADKFNAAITSPTKQMRQSYNELLNIRNQIRNFVVHGSFGKNFETFSFHSGAGAVPITMFPDKVKHKYHFGGIPAYEDYPAIAIIEQFIDLLWKDDRLLAKKYLMEHDLPVILTLAANGTYAEVLTSAEDMERFIWEVRRLVSDAENMD